MGHFRQSLQEPAIRVCPTALRTKQSGKGLPSFVLNHPLKMSGLSPFLTTQKLTLQVFTRLLV